MKNKIIASEFDLYFSSYKQYLAELLTKSNTFQIWRFQKSLRMAEYYRGRNKLLHAIWRRRKNIRGLNLGFDIPEGCFECGLRIFHISSVVVNPSAHIGKNCIIVGNCCIGNVKGLQVAPHIGDDCMFGWGTTVIGDVLLGDRCSVAAGAVVVKSFEENDVTLIGVPARKIGL